LLYIKTVSWIPQSADAVPRIETRFIALVSVPIMAKSFTVAKSLIIAALDEPEADGLACYSHAARPPENVLYANEANFSGVGVYEQLRFRNKSYKARLRRYRTAGFYLPAT
jgi:hypothetical protein